MLKPTQKLQDYTGGVVVGADDSPNGGYRYRVVVGWQEGSPVLEDSPMVYGWPEECRAALFARVKELRERDDDILMLGRLTGEIK